MTTLLLAALLRVAAAAGWEPPTATPSATPSPQPERALRFKVHWDDGLQYRLEQVIPLRPRGVLIPAEEFPSAAVLNGSVGVKLAVDAAGYVDHGRLPDIDDGIEVRRFYINTRGSLAYLFPIFFKVEFGVVDRAFFFREGWASLRDLPYVGTARIGQFNTPFALESLASSGDSAFMELGAPVQAFAPDIKVGFELANALLGERATWATGWFADGQKPDVGDDSKSFTRIVSRVTGLPIAGAGPDEPLLHVGLSASYVYSGNAEMAVQLQLQHPRPGSE